ncbi:PREDICTED: calpain-10 isoform X11 [Myotis brandtii]|uniref:calpain-10 isoform X11 n=1 Tax=Myotis brandtii TaxID=109478 RepID=UPI00070447DA|nr:PREDICTED: calpain-10 isoform X11 [Myotis brandtii]
MGRAGGRCPGGPNRWPGRKVEPEELGKQQKPTGWVWRLRTQDLLAAAQPQGAVSDQLLSVQPQGSAIKTVVQSPGPGETLLAGEWETVQLQGSWKIGQTAGGSRNFASYSSNPCFPLTIPEGAGPRCVRITLHQHCLDSDCHPIGFHVFQNGCEPRGVQKGVLPVPVDNGGQGTPSLLLQKPLLSCVPHCYTQEVSRVCHLSAGTYRIVPSTYLPDTEGAFTVTIATRIDRRSIHSQEMLGQLLQEASFMAVMKT